MEVRESEGVKCSQASKLKSEKRSEEGGELLGSWRVARLWPTDFEPAATLPEGVLLVRQTKVSIASWVAAIEQRSGLACPD